MSIIIKGIDKPLVCNECPCWNEEYTRCQVKDSWGKGYVYNEPPEWCPIEDAPAADVAPVRRGKWEERQFSNWPPEDYCSECGWVKHIEDGRYYRYCPNCGSNME